MARQTQLEYFLNLNLYKTTLEDTIGAQHVHEAHYHRETHVQLIILNKQHIWLCYQTVTLYKSYLTNQTGLCGPNRPVTHGCIQMPHIVKWS